MTLHYTLTSLAWTLSGWHPHFWRNRLSMETGIGLYGDVGSVQGALRDAGLLPDWNEGLNSRLCEWVENRHWVYETDLPAAWTAQPGSKWLVCDGLDYQGEVYLNGQRVGTFCGTFVPHSFDLTPFLTEGPQHLALVFTDIPASLGQVGYTSQMTAWKARFNYIWDWTPRLVQIGIWDDLRLEVRQDDAIEALSLYTEYACATGEGSVTLRAALTLARGTAVEVALADDTGEIAHDRFAATADFTASLAGLPVRPWHPNGNGDQPLYTLRVRVLSADGDVLEEETRRVGFKEVAWIANAGAPEGAEPWICEINGTPTFLQGINWVPIRPNFADVTEEDYRTRLMLYKAIGLNLLRVWGGAVLEREIFYRLCDELGLLVWQEFPQSSSGIDNWPSEDETAIAEMRQIAASYLARRQHHPALLLWCGGNELQGGWTAASRGAASRSRMPIR